jgi:hypothetical protein
LLQSGKFGEDEVVIDEIGKCASYETYEPEEIEDGE